MPSILSKIFSKLFHKKSSIKQTQNIYLNSILNLDYPGLHIYWTDKENKILLTNLSQARFFNKETPEGIAGKTVAEICNEFAIEPQLIKTICDNNRQLIKTGQPTLFEEHIDNKAYLSYKAPFYDERGEIQGIIGVS